MVLSTRRLFLRQFIIGDADSLYLLNRDDEVIKHTGDTPFASVEEARRFLQAYDHYRKYGYGRWAVIDKDSGDFIGWCGLKYTPELEECDIGFRFFKSCWNQGYATESASACLHYGFEHHGLSRIVGRAMKENSASVAVLEKIGMRYLGPFEFSGREGVLYGIDKPDEGGSGPSG